MKRFLEFFICILAVISLLVSCNHKSDNNADNNDSTDSQTTNSVSENNSSQLTDEEIFEQIKDSFDFDEPIVLPDDPILD